MNTEASNQSQTEKTAVEINKIMVDQNNSLSKSFVQPTSPTTGITNYNLEVPAKILFPVTSPIRNEIPRVKVYPGATAANWRAFTSLNPSKLLGVNTEGQRGSVLTDSVVSRTADFKQIGLENFATYEAQWASEGFGGYDVLAYMTTRTLYAVMEDEEKTILGGNSTISLGITPTPTLADITTSGALLPSTAYRVICVALAYEGNLVSSLTSGIVGQVTQNNADGSTNIYGGGSAGISVAATITTSAAANHSISGVVSVVNGAVSYAWYIGTTAGTERLAAITSTNSVLLTALNPTGQLASAIANGASDNSVNLTRYDGILTSIFDPASGSVVYNMPTGTPGQGSALTSSGNGKIVEIENILRDMWNTYRISPTTIWVNAREHQDINDKILSNGAAPLFRFNLDGGKANSLVGGSIAGNYLNPYTLGGGALIKIKLHPFMPAGTILFSCDNIQMSYPQSNVSNPLEMATRKDYYQKMWPERTKKFEYGVYVDSVLKNYFPPAFALIRNIGTA